MARISSMHNKHIAHNAKQLENLDLFIDKKYLKSRKPKIESSFWAIFCPLKYF